MISAVAFAAYDAALRELASSAESYVYEYLTSWLELTPGASVEEMREAAIQILQGANGVYGNAAATVANDFFDAEVVSQSGRVKTATALYDLDMDELSKVAHYQAGKLVKGDVAGFVKQIASYAGGNVGRAANKSMAHNAGRYSSNKAGVRWARVPTGVETCTFCVMLASRGFVYTSQSAAGDGAHYHRNCNCRVVASIDGLEGYDPDAYYDLWQTYKGLDSSENEDGSPVTRAETDALKEQFYHDLFG